MNPCLVCGHSSFRPLFAATDRLYRTAGREFQVVRCQNCGFMRLSPIPPPDELPRYYPKQYWYAPDSSFAARLEENYRKLVLGDHVRFVSRALSESGETGPVLDVGCGGGLFPRLLRARGFHAMGLDNSSDAASVAWHRNAVPVLCGNLAQAPLAPASCAGITMFHVLEHLYDPAAYLSAARILLKPNGRLIVQVPNAACWQFHLLGARWNGIDAPRHLTDFRSVDLEALLHAAGFAVVRRKFFSLRDNPAGLATSLAPGLDPMARRIRAIAETSLVRMAKDLAYFALLAAALPFTALEAAFGAGSTVMLEARKAV
jgi:SAM-dependent methyltransferase